MKENEEVSSIRETVEEACLLQEILFGRRH